MNRQVDKTFEWSSQTPPVLSHVFDIFLENAIHHLQADTGSVLLLDPDRTTFSLVAAHGLSPKVITVGRELPVAGSVAGEVLADGRPRCLVGRLPQSRWEATPNGAANPVSVVAPIRAEQEPLGTLNLTRFRAGSLPDAAQLAILEQRVVRLASIVQVLLPTRVEEARQRELWSLLEVVQRLQGALHIEETLSLARESVREIVRADHCLVALVGDQNALHVVQRESVDADLVAWAESGPGAALLRRTMDMGVYQTATRPGDTDYAQFRAALCVPIQLDRTVFGALACVCHASRQFDPRDIETMAILAHPVAVSLANARRAAELERYAFTDALTGLENRPYWLRRLHEELVRAERNGTCVSVVFFDVDNFKSYNDRFGHRLGDEVLKIIANVLRQAVRRNDNAARYGGEEFVLLLPDTTAEEALAVAERIRGDVERYALGSAGSPFEGLTVSGGIACYPVHGTTAEAVVDAADQAMYVAKKAGKNRMLLAE